MTKERLNKKKKLKKKTVGESSLELYKESPPAHTAIDQMREQLEDYEENIHLCVKNNKDLFCSDFYVVVITKKERLMQNVLRGYFFARKSCPTPDYDQAVYKYTYDGDNLEFLWVVPSADTVNYMKNNKSSVDFDKYALLSFVLKFDDGSLLRLSKEYNSEVRDSPLLEK